MVVQGTSGGECAHCKSEDEGEKGTHLGLWRSARSGGLRAQKRRKAQLPFYSFQRHLEDAGDYSAKDAYFMEDMSGLSCSGSRRYRGDDRSQCKTQMSTE